MVSSIVTKKRFIIVSGVLLICGAFAAVIGNMLVFDRITPPFTVGAVVFDLVSMGVVYGLSMMAYRIVLQLAAVDLLDSEIERRARENGEMREFLG